MDRGFDRPSAQAGDPRHEISGAVTGALIRRVRADAGEPGVSRMLALAGETRPPNVLQDPASFSSHNAVVALFEAAAEVTADPMIGQRAGEAMLHSAGNVDLPQLLRSLGSPGESIQNLTATVGNLMTVSAFHAVEVGFAHATVRVHTPHVRRHPLLCDFTRGMLSQIPALFGLLPAAVDELECQATGGRFCFYRLTWEDRQWSAAIDQRSRMYGDSDEPRRAVEQIDVAATSADTEPGSEPIPALRRQVETLTRQLREVYSAAGDLFDRKDADEILSRIAARAAHAVDAERYLLTVRLAPGQPKRIRHQGFGEAEAEALADMLLSDHPDDRSGSWLIVDVASASRLYGRLAAVAPPGASFSAADRHMLTLYTRYAAAALDTAAALDEAHQSGATARALLHFAHRLAEAGTPDDVARTLAATVVDVLGADQASVWLWHPNQECLICRARQLARPVTPVHLDRHGGADASGAMHAEHPQAAPSDRWDTVSGPGPGQVLYRSDTALIDQMRNGRSPVVVRHGDSARIPDALFSPADTGVAIVAALHAGDEFLGLVTAEYADPSVITSPGGPDPREGLTGLSDQAATAFVNSRLLEQVSHLAWHDDLTGLPNRRLLQDRANQELLRCRRTGEPLCVFFLDIDHFKQVNDTLGHAAGDELIVEVARRLQQTVRSQDTVARLGGDELAVLLPNLGTGAAASHLAQRALEALHAPYRVAGHELQASVSIGVAMAPDHGETWDQLLSAADEAMYRSKRLGRDTFHVYEPGLGLRSHPDLQLHADLGRAVERSELFLVYQPIVDMRTGHVTGVEALVRWAHPTLGLLTPSSFVPLAEESNLVVAIDQWVLQTACHQVHSWGLEAFRLVVNVSARDLDGDDYADSAIATLVNTGFDPRLLEIDVTDLVLATGTRHSMERLRRLGVRFAIDDFGAGRSPLNSLADLPVSTLKIDPSFVQVLRTDDSEAAMVSAITTMARALHIDCLAEGVETAMQFQFLARQGCQSAQGYFFSRPLPADGLRQLLTRPGALAAPSAPRRGSGATV